MNFPGLFNEEQQWTHFLSKFSFGCMDRLCGRTSSKKNTVAWRSCFYLLRGYRVTQATHSSMENRPEKIQFLMCLSHLIRPRLCKDTLNNVLIAHLRDLVNLMKMLPPERFRNAAYTTALLMLYAILQTGVFCLLSCNRYFLLKWWIRKISQISSLPHYFLSWILQIIRWAVNLFCGIELHFFFFFSVKLLVNNFAFLHPYKLPNRSKKMKSVCQIHSTPHVPPTMHLQKYSGSVFILGRRGKTVWNNPKHWYF